MIEYGYELDELGDDLYRVTVPDFPMLRICAQGHYDVRLEAQVALSVLISIRIRERLEVPKPSPASNSFKINEVLSLRLQLYWQMLDEGIGMSELSKRIELNAATVRDMLDGEETDDDLEFVQRIARRPLSAIDGDIFQFSFGRRDPELHRRIADMAIQAL